VSNGFLCVVNDGFVHGAFAVEHVDGVKQLTLSAVHPWECVNAVERASDIVPAWSVFHGGH